MNSYIYEILQKVSDTVEFADMENIDVNAIGMFQNRPLHIVISWSDPSALKALIEHGADVNARGERGFTPLHHAIFMKNVDAVDMLIANGADPTIKNDDSDDAVSLSRKVNDMPIIERLDRAPKLSAN